MPGSDNRPRPTLREQHVLQLVALGWTAQESAPVLDLSRSTVEKTRGALAKKLSARNLPHAVAIGYQTGLLPLAPERHDWLLARIERSS